MNCQNCNAVFVPKEIGAGRRKLYCSAKCKGQKNREKYKKPQIEKRCSICDKSFSTAFRHIVTCSEQCSYERQRVYARQKGQKRTIAKYPNRERTAPCGWCGELRTFKIGESVVNAYHPACTKEAERARYRIKTVKRQKHMNPNRISPDQMVREYGSDCHICNEPIDLTLPRTSKLGLTVDHLIPLSRGGTDTLDNLRPAHWTCNRRKSDKLMEELSA